MSLLGTDDVRWPQRRLLVAYSCLRRIGNADLFGYWPVAGASRTMAQIPSRLCSLPELFPFPAHQICASDFFPQPRRRCPRNSTVVFSSAMQSLTNRPMQITASDTFSLAPG